MDRTGAPIKRGRSGNQKLSGFLPPCASDERIHAHHPGSKAPGKLARAAASSILSSAS